jgi:N-acetylmuramoyl-L-alanine amidase
MKPAADIQAVLTPLQVLTLTLWAEARNQGRRGIVAVGSVIRNRANQPAWWGRDVRSVCLARYQFSCWNPGEDVNHLKLLALADRWADGAKPADLDRFLPMCHEVAAGILVNVITDTVLGSDHYFSPKGMLPRGTVPAWANDGTGQARPPTIIVNDHWFYKLGPDGRPD